MRLQRQLYVRVQRRSITAGLHQTVSDTRMTQAVAHTHLPEEAVRGVRAVRETRMPHAGRHTLTRMLEAVGGTCMSQAVTGRETGDGGNANKKRDRIALPTSHTLTCVREYAHNTRLLPAVLLQNSRKYLIYYEFSS